MNQTSSCLPLTSIRDGFSKPIDCAGKGTALKGAHPRDPDVDAAKNANLPNLNAKNANLPNVGEEFVKCFSIPAVRPAVLRGRVVVDYGSRSVRALAQPPQPHMHPSHTPQFPIPS